MSGYLMIDFNVRALIAVLYWTGLRISEVVGDNSIKYYTKREGWKWSDPVKGILKEDLLVDDDSDYILLNASEVRKHGKRNQPLWLKKNWLGIDQVLHTWEDTGKGERLFPIHKSFAWKLVKGASGYYPHYFRLNRATQFARHPMTNMIDLQEWFGWVDMRTIQSYLSKGGRQTRVMADRI